MIGSGSIGGKACGMLLARKIAQQEVPEFSAHNEPHDSFYIGSDVYYTYIVFNGDWRLRIRQRTEEGYFEAAGELQEHLLRGSFPKDPGKIHPGTGVFWPEPLHRALLQLSGGQLRQRVCRQV